MADNITLEQLKKMAQLADGRLDKLELHARRKQSLILSADGWTQDSGDANYPYRYVLTVEEVTADSKADAELDSGSIAIAMECGLYPFTETGEGTVTFKSCSVPGASLTGILYITRSAAISGS